jgi:hypothetical protein
MNKQGATMQFTAETVWACAAAAQRINEGYFKEDKWEVVNDQARKVSDANKVMVKAWLRETAMKLAAKEEFTGRDIYDFAVISCLPSVAVRDVANSELKREIYTSEQLQGAVGDTIVGDITVTKSRFNSDYNRYKITARMGESFVDFWFGKELEGTIRVKGKIKTQRGDKTTQLNYVKIVG